jgi:hypothetical protein
MAGLQCEGLTNTPGTQTACSRESLAPDDRQQTPIMCRKCTGREQAQDTQSEGPWDSLPAWALQTILQGANAGCVVLDAELLTVLGCTLDTGARLTQDHAPCLLKLV